MADIRYLERAFADAGVVEIRHQAGGSWRAGWFDDQGAAVRAIEARSGAGNLYTTLNRPGAGIRATNRFGGRFLGNDDMSNVVRMVFDFDPVRPTGLPSTDAEMTAAAECRDAVVAGLRAAGDWPAPALGLSGNGAHAVWRVNVDLSKSDWPAATGILYAAIRNKFADMLAERGVLFDTAVRNPGRIWRLYGVMNRKGESTPERPHRLASIWLPSRWDRIPGKKIAALVERWAPAVIKERKAVSAPILVKGRGDYRSLDIVAWFESRGLYRRYLEGAAHEVLCPWQDEHTRKGGKADTVIFTNAEGWPGFFCHHAHCAGRNVLDVMRLWGDADNYCARQWEGRRHG